MKNIITLCALVASANTYCSEDILKTISILEHKIEKQYTAIEDDFFNTLTSIHNKGYMSNTFSTKESFIFRIVPSFNENFIKVCNIKKELKNLSEDVKKNFNEKIKQYKKLLEEQDRILEFFNIILVKK